MPKPPVEDRDDLLQLHSASRGAFQRNVESGNLALVNIQIGGKATITGVEQGDTILGSLLPGLCVAVQRQLFVQSPLFAQNVGHLP
jgi:hypothetical protein